MDSNSKEEDKSLLEVKSAVNIMKDAIFQEIVACVENNGIILAMLEDSKEDTVLQQMVDTLHTVRVLGLTHDTCRILISNQTDPVSREENASPTNSKSGKINLTTNHTPVKGKTNLPSNLSLEESVRNALFGEVVQSIAKNECSLIMATDLKADETLQTALEILGNARIIYLAPDACEVLLVNRLKQGKKKSNGRSKLSGKCLAEEKTCHICKKQFSKRSGLLTHQKAFHDKYLPHKCDLCNKAFVYPKELRMHKLSHTGERPYRCNICNKGFIARKDVQRHQPVHTGERAFVCAICQATFAHKANLDRHIKSKHEGRRPYVCSLCVDKKYCDRGGLRKHLASVHRIFDVPRKKIVHRMIPTQVSDTVIGNNLETMHQSEEISRDLTQTQNFAPNHDLTLSRETVILGDLEMKTGAVTKDFPRSSDVKPDSLVNGLSDTHIVESASKILQQLSQNIAELNESPPTHHGLQKPHNSDNQPFTILEKGIVVPSSIMKDAMVHAAQEIVEEHSGEALVNIDAFTHPESLPSSSISEEPRSASQASIGATQLNRLEEIQTALQIVESPSNVSS